MAFYYCEECDATHKEGEGCGKAPAGVERKLAAIDGKLDALLLHLGVSQLPIMKPGMVKRLWEFLDKEMKETLDESQIDSLL